MGRKQMLELIGYIIVTISISVLISLPFINNSSNGLFWMDIVFVTIGMLFLLFINGYEQDE